MTMASYPRPSAMGSRPAYLDNLFRDTSNPSSAHSSTHSSTSSFSASSTASNWDLRSAFNSSRPLTPAAEESSSDTLSIRSKKSFVLSPKRFRFGAILHRRTYPQTEQRSEELDRPTTARTISAPVVIAQLPSQPPSPPVTVRNTSRRPALPKLQTSFPPPQAVNAYAKRPLPAVPSMSKLQRPRLERQETTELSCQPCYYFTARNCNGYVLGGESGDSCESCLQSGFFGAK